MGWRLRRRITVGIGILSALLPIPAGVEGLTPVTAAAPYHPNAKGMAASGATVAAAVKTPARSAL